ncbi:MAG: hypothetical protein E6Q97_24500 [Desulfurellales bacterium]|nr:MAG: hypothetical protein E6Q97_24500 [Desulfurellales bacterium]
MITLDLRNARAGFFDSEKVVRLVDKANRKNLSKAGAFVRQTARNSIRRRKGSSKPGQAPTNITGTLKRFLFFAYDTGTKTTVVGPAATNQVFFNGAGQPVRGTVPQVLERGGSIQLLEVQWSDGVWRRADLRSRRRIAEKPQRMRTVRIEARPYMGPAYTANEKKIALLWKDSVKE